MIQRSLLSLCIIKHTELTRGCWPEKYTNTHLSVTMQNCSVCTLEKNMQCLPKATKIYMVAYLLPFWFRAAMQFGNKPPDCSHLLHTGSAPRAVLVHRSTEFRLQGTNPEALLSAHEMHSSEGVMSPNQPVGLWAAFGQLAWWEEPIQGIKLKVAWSSNPCNVYNKHTASQH